MKVKRLNGAVQLELQFLSLGGAERAGHRACRCARERRSGGGVRDLALQLADQRAHLVTLG
ncbi:MAG: hypothetical protein AAB113_01950, partial [Candidatus Eisenbacteria bacterium]